MWQVWVRLKNGASVFIAEYVDQNTARWWAYSWLDRGFIPLPSGDPNLEIQLPRSGLDMEFVFTKSSTTPDPDNAVTVADLLNLSQ